MKDSTSRLVEAHLLNVRKSEDSKCFLLQQNLRFKIPKLKTNIPMRTNQTRTLESSKSNDKIRRTIKLVMDYKIRILELVHITRILQFAMDCNGILQFAMNCNEILQFQNKALTHSLKKFYMFLRKQLSELERLKISFHVCMYFSLQKMLPPQWLPYKTNK